MGATAKRHESARHCPTRGSQPFLVSTIFTLRTTTLIYTLLRDTILRLLGIVILRVLRARDVSFVGAAVLRCVLCSLCVFKGMISYLCPVALASMFVVLS